MVSHSVVSKPFAGQSPVELIAMGPRTNPGLEAIRLERILSPASREQRLSAILDLMGQFGVTAPKGADEERLFFEGYLLALEGYPIWCILETCRAFVRGEVDVSNREFLPKPATVGAELSRRVDTYRSGLRRARKQTAENAELEIEHTGPLDPELRERGRIRAEELRAQAIAEREALSRPAGIDFSAYYRRGDDVATADRPLTAEDVAHIPDAPRRDRAGVQKIQPPSAFDALRRKA